MSFDPAEIAEMFAGLALSETDGQDLVTYTCEQTVSRWADYEAERTWWRENDEGYRRRRAEQWTRANVTRKRKRRGLHLSNAERAAWADRLARGEVTSAEVARETGMSEAVATNVGQLSLLEGVA